MVILKISPEDVEAVKDALRISRAVAYTNMHDEESSTKARASSRRAFRALGGYLQQLAPETKVGYRTYESNDKLTIGEVRWNANTPTRWHILNTATGAVLSEYETYGEARAAFDQLMGQDEGKLADLLPRVVSDVAGPAPATE